MEHKFNCLIYVCTCNVPAKEDEEKDTTELLDVLSGLDNVSYKEDTDV